MTIDIRARLAEVMPGIRRDLEDLVRIQSVQRRPRAAGEVERSARGDARPVRGRGLRARDRARLRRRAAGRDRARRPGPRARPPSCSTPTTTSSPRTTTPTGTPRRGSPPSATTASTAVAPPTTRPASPPTSARVRVFGDELPVNLVMFIEGEEEVGSDTLVELLDALQGPPRRRRHRHRRLRQLGHRRARPDHEPARPGPDRRRGPHPDPRRPPRHVGRPGARLDHHPVPAHRLAARRRRQPRGRGPGQRPGRRRRLPRGPPARRVRRGRASSGSAPAPWSSGCGPSPRSASPASTPPRSTARPTPSSPPPAARISCASRPATPRRTPSTCLRPHLEKHVPWGAQLTNDGRRHRRADALDVTGPAYDAARAAFTEAWDGTEPVDMGVGGSIPFIAEFLEAFPTPACWSPASRTPTPAPTAPTRACTSPSSRRSSSPRPSCSATSARCARPDGRGGR